MKLLKRLYMKMHGFEREINPYTGWECWRRKGIKNSYDSKDMIMEVILYSLSWKEIVKRYGKSRESV